VLDSSFQFLFCPRAYVCRLQHSGAPREKSHKRRDRVNVLATGCHLIVRLGALETFLVGRPWILSPCEQWYHPVGSTLLDFHARSVSAPGSCVTSAHNDLKLLSSSKKYGPITPISTTAHQTTRWLCRGRSLSCRGLFSAHY
jgi:hypothetical protein